MSRPVTVERLLAALRKVRLLERQSPAFARQLSLDLWEIAAAHLGARNMARLLAEDASEAAADDPAACKVRPDS